VEEQLAAYFNSLTFGRKHYRARTHLDGAGLWHQPYVRTARSYTGMMPAWEWRRSMATEDKSQGQ